MSNAASTEQEPQSAKRGPEHGLGAFFRHKVAHPFYGLLFDLSGGVFQVDGCRFVIPRSMTTIGWRGISFWKGGYEGDERALVTRHLRPGDGVIELGACIGVVSCITNRLLEDRARHLVVEANPFVIPWLIRNRNMNGARFIVEHCAVAEPPEVTFYVNPTVIVDGSSQRKSDCELRLPSRPLQELCERYGPFSTLIMDIEGSEVNVLETSQNLLRSFRLVVVELHEWIVGVEKISRCRRILEDCGFRAVDRAGVTEVWQRE
jgi:FkbM family methyltransferase